MQRIVANGARSSRRKLPDPWPNTHRPPLGRVVQAALLPLVLRWLVTDKSQAWIYNHHIDWHTPSVAT